MEFTELNLHPDLQRGIADADYVTCMPVQEQVLKNAFGGQDLYVQSQTGTGKTAAYLIVILQRLLSEPLLNGKKALIMVPTRELAVQVEEEAKLLSKYLPFKVGSFYGGVGYAHQQKILRENAQILVGTPGRVLDLNGSGQMNLMDLAFLVLDEADRMFDMGFYPDLRKLIKVVPPADRRQTMLFSATLNAWVKNLAWEYTKTPFEIEIAPEKVTVEEIEQILYHVSSNDKMKLLMGILRDKAPESAVIFCNTKKYTEIVAKRLRINGIDCEFIIGDLPQVKRLKIIEDIKAGVTRFLVATDVAARGLDIEGLAMVVNYDLPNEAENYIHRIGRTARAGKTGVAISMAGEQDVYELPAIEKYMGKKIPSEHATENLFAEDKSEGMRIRTDIYDDRRHDDDRGDRRGGRGRPHGDDRHGRGAGRRSEHGEGGRRPEGADGRPRRRADEGRGGPRHDPTAAKTDLSHLPFEERMAYYKRKYEADEARIAEGNGPAERQERRPPAPNRGRGAGAPRQDRPRQEEARRDDRRGARPEAGARQGGNRPAAPRQGSPKQGGVRSGEDRARRGRPQGSPGSQAGRGGQGAAKATGPKGAAAKQAPKSTEKKSGIVSRLLGLFKKKES